MAFDKNGDMFLALREGNAVFRIDMKSETLHHIAGTGEKGYAGDGGPARMAVDLFIRPDEIYTVQ